MMKKTRMHAITKRPENGAALLVALILLVVITILAVSAMGTARLGLLMAGNAQYSLRAFQAAQSAIEARIAFGGFSTDLNNESTTYPFTDAATGINSTGIAVISYQDATDVPAGGYSLGSSYLAYHFEIDASGTALRGAVSSQMQGFYVVGPGAN